MHVSDSAVQDHTMQETYREVDKALSALWVPRSLGNVHDISVLDFT